jgi:hypothetical protein
VYVTLVTPRCAVTKKAQPPLWCQLRYPEYDDNRDALLGNLVACCLHERNGKHWWYPDDTRARVEGPVLHGTVWEGLFAALPQPHITRAARILRNRGWHY